MSYRVIRDGVEIGVSPTIVHIYLGDNGAYQECPANEATGFCVKLPRLAEPAESEEQAEGMEIELTNELLFDTVFSLPRRGLKGAVGEAIYEVKA